jgi:type II secretory pathway component GspD/PulD (secretin)
MSRWFAWLVLGMVALAVRADEVEVIALRYRTFDQVAPILRPLVEPNGALTGMQSTLVIRASRRNIEDIKRVLASVDTLPRRLLISVRQDAGTLVSEQGGAVSGRAGGERGGVVIGEPRRSPGLDARVYSSRSASDERISQQVQTIDGAPAYIQIGQAVPVRSQSVHRSINGVIVSDNVTFQDVTTGFSVVPRLHGEQVTLEISPQRDTLSTSGNIGAPPVINSQRIVTTVAGRLGEWIDLGAASADDRRDERGPLSSAAAAREDRRRVWVRVEALP